MVVGARPARAVVAVVTAAASACRYSAEPVLIRARPAAPLEVDPGDAEVGQVRGEVGDLDGVVAVAALQVHGDRDG